MQFKQNLKSDSNGAMLEIQPDSSGGFVLQKSWSESLLPLTFNEDEERLLEDVKIYLEKLAPPSGIYLHNDLHLRDVPPDEPINAHSQLMAMMLSTSEVIPIGDGKLAIYLVF